MAKNRHYQRCKIDLKAIRNSSENNLEYITQVLEYIVCYANNLNFNHHPEDLNSLFFKMSGLINQLDKSELSQVYELFNDAQVKIAKILRKTPRRVRTNNPNVLNLKEAMYKIEAIISSLDLGLIEKFEGSSYDFFKYLILKFQSEEVLEMTLNKYPFFINIENETGESLIDAIVDEYLKEIANYLNGSERKKHDLLQYYDHALDMIIKHKKFKTENLHARENLEKLRKFKKETDLSKTDKENKSKLVYWLNQLNDRLSSRTLDFDYEELKYRSDIIEDFNAGVLSEARYISNNLFETRYIAIENNERFAFTIDEANTKDRDDALSISKDEYNRYILGVHITDPLAYISSDNIIFEEAINRTTSVYSGHYKIFSMLPDEFSRGVASLTKNRLSYVNSYYMTINDYGEVEDFYFKKERIKIFNSYSYQQINKICNSFTDDPRLSVSIEHLLDLKNILAQTNKKDILYESLKVSESNLSKTNITSRGASQEIVAQTMLVANKTVAKYFADHNYPLLFRNHVLNPEITEELEYYGSLLAREKDSTKFLKSIKKFYPSATYEIDNKGHQGLGIDAYTHVTSPLRRLADLINLECLNRFYYKTPVENDFLVAEQLITQAEQQIKAKTKQLETFHKNYFKVKDK